MKTFANNAPVLLVLSLLLLSAAAPSVLCAAPQHQHRGVSLEGGSVVIPFAGNHACLQGWRAGPVNCTGANLFGVDFGRAYLPDSRFDKAYLAHASFKDAYLSGSTFDSAVINQVDFSGIQAKGVSLRYAIVVESNMREAVLDYADMTGASWQGCRDLGSVSAFQAEMLSSDDALFSFSSALESSSAIADAAAAAASRSVDSPTIAMQVSPSRQWIKQALLSPAARDTLGMIFATLALAWSISVGPQKVMAPIRAYIRRQSSAATANVPPTANPTSTKTQQEMMQEDENKEEEEEDLVLSELLAKERTPFKEIDRTNVETQTQKASKVIREGKENMPPPVLEKKPIVFDQVKVRPAAGAVTKRDKIIFTASSPLIPSPIKRKYPRKEDSAALLSPDSNCSETEVYLKPFSRKRNNYDRYSRTQLPPARMLR